MGRLGEPADVAAAAVQLASEVAGCLTGAMVEVDWELYMVGGGL